MVNTERKSTTSLARNLLARADEIVDAYRTGAISQDEAVRRYESEMSRFHQNAYANFLVRIDNSRFFRDPVPQLDRDASPAERSRG